MDSRRLVRAADGRTRPSGDGHNLTASARLKSRPRWFFNSGEDAPPAEFDAAQSHPPGGFFVRSKMTNGQNSVRLYFLAAFHFVVLYIAPSNVQLQRVLFTSVSRFAYGLLNYAKPAPQNFFGIVIFLRRKSTNVMDVRSFRQRCGFIEFKCAMQGKEWRRIQGA